MVELQHSTVPPALITFLAENPAATVSYFDDQAFKPVKDVVKAALNGDQNGLCVYCEKIMSPSEGQVEHIKPKGGINAHPDLCFSYTNLVQSCINSKTCGQKKAAGILPIEPSIGCNDKWIFSVTDASIQPIVGLTKSQRHPVRQTLDMLGLNRDPALVQERKKWFAKVEQVLKEAPQDVDLFLQVIPYRYIFATVL